jgi:hypothetical protein
MHVWTFLSVAMASAARRVLHAVTPVLKTSAKSQTCAKLTDESIDEQAL